MSKKGAQKTGGHRKRNAGGASLAPKERSATLSAMEMRTRSALGFDMKPFHGGPAKRVVAAEAAEASAAVKKKGFKKRQ